MRTIALSVAFSLTATMAFCGPFIVVQSTTSTANSGLYDAILPQFEAESGIEVRVVAVGTGQALNNARNCDGDVLLVHAKSAEEQFVAEGYGTERFDVMYNDFIIVGPGVDPAHLNDAENANVALSSISATGETFVSRGDESGTHQKERALWDVAGIDTEENNGDWYRETGSGMGATLNAAVAMGAYTMTDRATWLAFGNRNTHEILFEGDPVLFNQYGIIAVNPEVCPNVRSEQAQVFVDWMLSDAGQSAIGAYTRNGEQLFFPNAD